MHIRADMAEAQANAWTRIGEPGTWWTGAERVAIAAEARHALACPLCAARKAALSPAAVGGDHATSGALPGAAVEAIHRIRTDPGRLGEAWYRGVLAGGLDADRYAELLSVVVVTVAVDTFRHAVGLDPLKLPTARPGVPTRRSPLGKKPGPGWGFCLAAEDRGDGDPDLYCEHPGPRTRSGANVILALSAVPDAMMHWWDMFETMYQPGPWMRDFTREYRAISHAQIEMLAARVAALNQCEY
jgi:hypothetical protein